MPAPVAETSAILQSRTSGSRRGRCRRRAGSDRSRPVAVGSDPPGNRIRGDMIICHGTPRIIGRTLPAGSRVRSSDHDANAEDVRASSSASLSRPPRGPRKLRTIDDRRQLPHIPLIGDSFGDHGLPIEANGDDRGAIEQASRRDRTEEAFGAAEAFRTIGRPDEALAGNDIAIGVSRSVARDRRRAPPHRAGRALAPRASRSGINAASSASRRN